MSPAKRTPSAVNRRTYHLRKIAAEPTVLRKALRAAGWVVSEVNHLGDADGPEVLRRLTSLARELNERNASS